MKAGSERAVSGKILSVLLVLLLAACAKPATVPTVNAASQSQVSVNNPLYDAALAAKTGANDNGMRSYVFVLLKSSTTPVPKGPERDAMFKGHFANMTRLADAGILAYAGPLDGVDGWRGLFILAVDSIDEAKRHVATDPVITQGEMVAEYHKHFGSAALMLINEFHPKLGKTPM